MRCLWRKVGHEVGIEEGNGPGRKIIDRWAGSDELRGGRGRSHAAVCARQLERGAAWTGRTICCSECRPSFWSHAGQFCVLGGGDAAVVSILGRLGISVA